MSYSKLGWHNQVFGWWACVALYLAESQKGNRSNFLSHGLIFINLPTAVIKKRQKLWKHLCPAGTRLKVFFFTSLVSTNHYTLEQSLIESLICFVPLQLWEMYEGPCKLNLSKFLHFGHLTWNKWIPVLHSSGHAGNTLWIGSVLAHPFHDSGHKSRVGMAETHIFQILFQPVERLSKPEPAQTGTGSNL